jgi:hypothetical protein
MAQRSVSYLFAHRALPTLFHADPQSFFQRLQKNGRLLLGMLWDKCARSVDASGVPIELDVRLIRQGGDTTMALITLPLPRCEGEAFFTAAWQGTQTRLFTRTLGRPRYFTLERQDLHEQSTEIGEWDREGRHSHGAGPAAQPAEFLAALERLMSAEQARAR